MYRYLYPRYPLDVVGKYWFYRDGRTAKSPHFAGFFVVFGLFWTSWNVVVVDGTGIEPVTPAV